MIWIFGDSYSANFDHDWQGPFSLEYINYKGYIPKTFGGFLSDYLNCEHINLAIPGNNNDSIFEEVIKNAPIIRKGDIVIIGWSDIIRFRLAEHENEKTFISVLPRRNKPERLADVSVNTTDEILVNRMSSAYYEEFKIRFNFINWLFRDNILIQWTCHHCNISGKDECDVLNFTKPYLNTIILETDGLIKDTHYSEEGHKQLTNNFIELINDEELRHLNNSITIKEPVIEEEIIIPKVTILHPRERKLI